MSRTTKAVGVLPRATESIKIDIFSPVWSTIAVMPKLTKATQKVWDLNRREAVRCVANILSAFRDPTQGMGWIQYKLGVTWNTVHRWRAGEVAPHASQLEMLKKLAEQKGRVLHAIRAAG